MRVLAWLAALGAVLSACGSPTLPTETPPAAPLSDEVYQRIEQMACGAVDCLAAVCPAGTPCPLALALADEAVFQFVSEYSPCAGCQTPVLPVGEGIGRCIEYEVVESSDQWTVWFWVSENCAFRYGQPSQARINVVVGRDTGAIETVAPPAATIRDPGYCERDGDCACLSGSGLPLVGCANRFYAPLHWAGSYGCAQCVCRESQCRIK